MQRPPASRESGEHILELGSETARHGPPRPPRRRRDSGDRISFDSIARLVQPSMPPRAYDTLTPVTHSDLAPPAMPAAPGPRRRRGVGVGVKVLSALAAVAIGAGVSAALHAEPSAPTEQVVAGAALAPAAGTHEVVAATATPEEEVVQLGAQVLPAEPAERAEAAEPSEAPRHAAPEEEGRDRRALDGVRDDDDERARRADQRAEERSATPHRAEEQDTAAPVAGAAPAVEPAAETGESEEPVAEEPAAELPERPTRDDVQSTMLGALPAIRECAAGQNGTVTVEVTAGSSGRVRNVLVTGAFSGTPEGSCMAREVRRVRFPRFAEDSFTVRYPFRI